MPRLDNSAFDHDFDSNLDSADFVYEGFGKGINIPVGGYLDSELSSESSEDHEDRDKLGATAFQKQQVQLV